MHRNVDIWEKRHERLEAISSREARDVSHARHGARDHDELSAIIQRHVDWRVNRFDPLARRVWRALCVAKGWRKA